MPYQLTESSYTTGFYCILLFKFCHFVAVTVFFEKSSYTVDKFLPQLSIFLHLSKPMKTDVAITIIDKEGTATSESLNRIVR